MPKQIDVDRGVTVKRQKIEDGGMYIYMYLDAPGVFLDAHGRQVVDELAKSVGYDTDGLGKQRLLRERQASALEAIAKEMEYAEAGTEIVIAESGEFRVVDVTNGYANVLDGNSEKVNTLPVTHEAALKLLDLLGKKASAGASASKPGHGLVRNPKTDTQA